MCLLAIHVPYFLNYLVAQYSLCCFVLFIYLKKIYIFQIHVSKLRFRFLKGLLMSGSIKFQKSLSCCFIRVCLCSVVLCPLRQPFAFLSLMKLLVLFCLLEALQIYRICLGLCFVFTLLYGVTNGPRFIFTMCLSSCCSPVYGRVLLSHPELS